ncbi:MAG: membrane protein insertase YidC [Sphingomonadaceae bacterium]|nr:membrane protein insertase YidC [Sphingomonadaceae bacterium]
MDNTRNMILAIVLSAAVLFGWSFLSEQIAPTATEPSTEFVDGEQVVLPNPDASPAADTPVAVRELSKVLSESRGNRVLIETPRLNGSINLRGARIDDLVLEDYRETIAEDSPPIRMLTPEGAEGAHYAHFGWAAGDIDTPDGDTLWQASSDRLSPGNPVTLQWRNGSGQLFEIILEVDENFLFSVAQRVSNTGDGPVSAQPYSLVTRAGVSPDPDTWLIHTGPTGVWNDDLNHIDFDDVRDAGTNGERFSIADGWLGFNDKYWLTALAPASGHNVEAAFIPLSDDRYQAVFTSPANIIQAGRAITTRTSFFAGAKEVILLEQYDEAGFNQIDLSVDWGWFYWFELPIFYLLHWLFSTIGNFGVAIICMTFIVRGLMFPIAQKQFASMAGMRAVQPKMKEVQERYKDDKQKMQQEILSLYKREKVNPFGGCLPIFLQIPIFFALYKVLMLSVEMRHEPFILWLRDLSAPDPLTPVNLFGLLAFTPPQFMAIGILPILLGISMWLQFKLNPAQMDPTQQKIFMIMPWVLMVIMAPFAAGLQLYWVTSNVLTIAQQKWFYSRDPRLKELAKAEQPAE